MMSQMVVVLMKMKMLLRMSEDERDGVVAYFFSA